MQAWAFFSPSIQSQNVSIHIIKKKNEEAHRINEKIRGVREVRLVGENVEVGVYPIERALAIADDLNLDLVEISPNAEPPVCRVVDYQKFLYQQKKREKEINLFTNRNFRFSDLFKLEIYFDRFYETRKTNTSKIRAD